MPGLVSSILIQQHDSATDFLSAVISDLARNELSSNIIFAHALKRANLEAGRTFSSELDLRNWLRSPTSFKPIRSPSNSFWLTVWSYGGPSTPPSLEIVLSCIDWIMGEYPIFLWTPRRPGAIDPSWVGSLANHLLSCVPPERVFTVFGVTPLVKTFTKFWTERTGFRLVKEPVYAASYSYCSPATFNDVEWRVPAGHQIRRATMEDLEAVGRLCKEFADDGVYFPLTLEGGRMEAREFISKGQMWIYNVNGECSTICAVTRNTFNVSAITKVYTTPKFRKMGCAENIVRYVTRRLLRHDRKSYVTLYVGHENNAQRVYDRVGFVGLCGKPKTDGVEDALELGFVGARKGYW